MGYQGLDFMGPRSDSGSGIGDIFQGAVIRDNSIRSAPAIRDNSSQGFTASIGDNRMPAGNIVRNNSDQGFTTSIRDNRMPTENTIRDNRMHSGGMMAFADGGEVPQDIFARTRARREQEAGLNGSTQQPGNITINIGNAGDQKQEGKVPRSEAQMPSMNDMAASIGNLLQSIVGFQDGGKIRTGSSDVKAGGEIRGPESKSGRDNQIIKVAGGEGILPKDVMDVPGVADLVQSLIQTYHTPVK